MTLSPMKVKELLAQISDSPVLELDDIEVNDVPRILAALRPKIYDPLQLDQLLLKELQRNPGKSALNLATKLRAQYRQVEGALRNRVGTWKDAEKAVDANHNDFSRTWFGRHIKTIDTRDKFRTIIKNLQTELDSDEQGAFLVGAPTVRAYREAVAESQDIPLTESAGISASRAASHLKHELNELVIGAAEYSGILVAIEVGQGVGDGTLRYQKHGLVLSLESDPKCLAISSSRVPHLAIYPEAPMRESSPLLMTPNQLREQFAQFGYMPALLFSEPTSANVAVKILEISGWRFNWVDIDPLGFAEASDINVTSFMNMSDTEAIICITNGGWHADRYGTRTKMLEVLTPLQRYSENGRQDQRDQLMRNLLETEAAYRIEQAAQMGTALYPLLLYDGRNGHSGVLRSYYVLFRVGNPQEARAYVEYNTKASLWALAPKLIARVGSVDSFSPTPGQVLSVRFEDLGTSTWQLTHAQSAQIGGALHRRIAYLRDQNRKK